MEKKKSKGKLIALIIAIVVVVGVVATGIVLAATGTLFGSTKEKAFETGAGKDDTVSSEQAAWS